MSEEKKEKKKEKGRPSKSKEDPEQKKKFEIELEADSSDDEEDVKVTRVGYVEMKTKKTWRAVYCVLIGGTFYFYKNNSSSDPEPKGKVELADLDLETPAKGEKKDYTFFWKKGDEIIFIGACSSEPELDQWTKVFKENKNKPSALPPTSTVKSPKKPSLGQRAKKKLLQKLQPQLLVKKS